MAVDSHASTDAHAVDMLIGPDDDYVFRVPQISSNVFYGRFGGLSVLRSVSRSLMPPSSEVSSAGIELVEAFHDLTLSSRKGSFDGRVRSTAFLPSRNEVRNHITHACRTGLICHDCLDHAHLSEQLELLYDVESEDFSADLQQSLALVYALLALSRRYAPTGTTTQDTEDPDNITLRGFRFFRTSCRIIQNAEWYTLDSLRAIICQTRYLLSASMISDAHSLLVTGISAAIRMGMHVSDPGPGFFSAEELLQRRRVFAVMNMMDTYLASLLGLPKVVNNADFEQTIGLSDEDLPDLGHDFILRHPTDPVAEAALCQKLSIILAKMSDHRLSAAKTSPVLQGETYQESDSFVAMREAELQEWHNDLPAMLEDTGDRRALQVQLMLRLWHATAQIVLYRPFLHHVARDAQDPKFDFRGYEYGSACVRSAMQAVWLAEVLKTNSMQHEAYYLLMYTLGYSANILAFFVTSSSQRATVTESTVAAWKARDMLAELGKHSLSARRYTASLNVVLDDLPSFQDGTRALIAQES